MTKERLEEIRHRKYAEDRIVYTVFDGNKEATALHIVYDNELFVAYISLKRLYETKEEAEWYCKMNAERTERFEPPMWEDIDNVYQFKFYCNNKYYYCFTVNKELNFIDVDTSFGSLTKLRATKEDYEKACEIVMDLFKK